MKLVLLQKYVVRALVYGPPARKPDASPTKAPGDGAKAIGTKASVEKSTPEPTGGRWECFIQREVVGQNVFFHLYYGLARLITDSGYRGDQPFSKICLVNPITTLTNPQGCSITPTGNLVMESSLPFVLEEDPRVDWWRSVQVPYYPLFGETVLSDLRPAKVLATETRQEGKRSLPSGLLALLPGAKREAA